MAVLRVPGETNLKSYNIQVVLRIEGDESEDIINDKITEIIYGKNIYDAIKRIDQITIDMKEFFPKIFNIISESEED